MKLGHCRYIIECLTETTGEVLLLVNDRLKLLQKFVQRRSTPVCAVMQKGAWLSALRRIMWLDGSRFLTVCGSEVGPKCCTHCAIPLKFSVTLRAVQVRVPKPG